MSGGDVTGTVIESARVRVCRQWQSGVGHNFTCDLFGLCVKLRSPLFFF